MQIIILPSLKIMKIILDNLIAYQKFGIFNKFQEKYKNITLLEIYINELVRN